MPTSPSVKRPAKPPRGAPAAAPGLPRGAIAAALLAVVAVGVVALPASLLGRLLPANLSAQDFSGSLWHGSAGRLAWGGRELGALEWRLHPLALLRLTAAAQLHWVKAGWVLDGGVELSRHGLRVEELRGGGPLEDLAARGIAPGWHGAADLHGQRLQAACADDGIRWQAASGEAEVTGLRAPQVAAGADLGGYALRLPADAIAADGTLSATLTDTGGPLQLQAGIQFSTRERRGVLSGTVLARAQAPEALRAQLAQLAQLHAPDAQGRIPFDLELSL